MPAANRTDGVCETSRRLPFERAAVFAAFAHADQLAQWWGPDGFTNAFEVFEFRPQGRWTFVMQGPDGTRYPNESIFLETAPERVVIHHSCAPYFKLTVSLTEVDGQTELHWRQVFEDAALVANIRHILEPANEQNLNRLHRLLADRHSQ